MFTRWFMLQTSLSGINLFACSLWRAVDILTLNLWTYFIFIYYPKASHWCKKYEHTDGLISLPPPPDPALLLEEMNSLLKSPSVNPGIFQDSFSTVSRNNAAHIVVFLTSFSCRSHLLWLVLPSMKMLMFLRGSCTLKLPKSCPLGAQICGGL